MFLTITHSIAYFRLNSDTNVIVVNWEKLAAAPWYDAAAANTKPVGQLVAFIYECSSV
jgi:hypothetical protein